MDARVGEELLYDAEALLRDELDIAGITREQLLGILESMTDTVIYVMKDGSCISANREAGKAVVPPSVYNRDNYELFKLYDLEGRVLVFEDTPVYCILQKKSFFDKRIALRKAGVFWYYSVSGIPLQGSSSGNIAGIIIMKDISHEIREKKRKEEDMLKQSELISILVHEFKTPINVINAAVQALEIICKSDMSDKAKSFIGMIRQNSLRQLRLVNNLLDIMKMESGYYKEKRNNTDIIPITRSIVQSVMLYAEEKGVKLAFTSRFSSIPVSIDEEKYERILLNLLSNAIKFTPTGKSIKVSAVLEKGQVCVSVKDEGIGIPPEKLDYIFDRFSQLDNSLTVSAEGTGIGLALVKLLVAAMKGEINVRSKEGKGSNFTLKLPAHKPIEEVQENTAMVLGDSRLMQAAAIEFSNIYLQ